MTTPPRYGNWLQTYTGRQFYPLDPRPDDVDPTDIAHALSLLCRYGGHVDRFYSVAEHCVLMSHTFQDSHLALWALLHDATEAYVIDVPRPLKRHLVGYADIEDNVMTSIATRFGLHGATPPVVKEADNRILLDERNTLMSNTRHQWDVDALEPLGVTINGWSPREAETQYLIRLYELAGGYPAARTGLPLPRSGERMSAPTPLTAGDLHQIADAVSAVEASRLGEQGIIGDIEVLRPDGDDRIGHIVRFDQDDPALGWGFLPDNQ